MVIVLDQYTPTEEFIHVLTKSFTKQLEQKSYITSRIKATKGGEQLSWIKKYNGLFIHHWGYKEKKILNDSIVSRGRRIVYEYHFDIFLFFSFSELNIS